MNDVLYEKFDIFLNIYLDDILIFLQDPNAHEEQLHWGFN